MTILGRIRCLLGLHDWRGRVRGGLFIRHQRCAVLYPFCCCPRCGRCDKSLWW